jgi:hypothetical protein
MSVPPLSAAMADIDKHDEMAALRMADRCVHRRMAATADMAAIPPNIVLGVISASRVRRRFAAPCVRWS